MAVQFEDDVWQQLLALDHGLQCFPLGEQPEEPGDHLRVQAPRHGAIADRHAGKRAVGGAADHGAVGGG